MLGRTLHFRSPVDAASTGRPGATAGITSSEARQYLQQDSESSEKRTLWGRIRKGGITSSTSSTVTDVPVSVPQGGGGGGG